MATFNLTLDMGKRSALPPEITVRCGEQSSQYVRVTLMEDGKAYSVPTGATVRLQVKRADGGVIRTVATRESSNVYTARIPGQTFTAVGISRVAYIAVYNGDQMATSQDFRLIVLPGTTDEVMVKYYDEQLNEILETARGEAGAIANEEAARKQAEAQRQANETARQSAESTRQSQEATRQSNETARKTAETARQSQESTRQSQETARQNAEKARAEAEQARVDEWAIVKGEVTSTFQDWTEAERVRQAQEAIRESNEATRQENEEKRETQEQRREDDTAQAIEDAKTKTDQAVEDAQSQIDDKLSGVDGKIDEAVERTKDAIQEALDAADRANNARAPKISCGTAINKAGGHIEDERDGDVYINNDTHEVFQFVDGNWVYQFTIDGSGTIIPTVQIAVEIDDPKPLYSVGDVIDYTVTILSTSVIAIYDLILSASVGELDTPVYGEIRPGATVTVSGHHTVAYSDYGNNRPIVVTAHNSLVPQMTAQTVDLVFPERIATLSISKTLTNEEDPYYVGDVLRYKTTVTNTGNVPLENITVRPLLDGEQTQAGSGYTVEDNAAQIAALQAGAQATVTSILALTDTHRGTTVTSTSQAASSDTGIPVTASAETARVADELRELAMAVTITNQGTGPGGVFVEADVIEYAITLKNPHEVAFTDIHVSAPGFVIEDGTGYEVTDNAVIPELPPEASVTVEAAYLVERTDLGRTDLICRAIADYKGQSANRQQTEAESAPAVMDAVRKTLQLTVTETSTGTGLDGAYREGDRITYRLTATNTGNVDIADLVIATDLTGCTIDNQGQSVTVPLMVPAHVEEWAMAYEVGAHDTRLGQVVNTVTAMAEGISETQTVTSRTELTVSAIDLDVTVTSTPHKVGDAYCESDNVTYTVTVRNSGNTVIDDLVLESIGGTIEGAPSVNVPALNPGQSEVYPSGIYTITDDDVTATRTSVGVIATATGIEESVTREVYTQERVYRVLVNVYNTSGAGPYNLGDTITGRIEIHNQSTQDVSNIKVTVTPPDVEVL